MMRSVFGVGVVLVLANAACAKDESPWACGAEDVPMGQVTTCTTTQSVTADGPIVDGTEFDCPEGSTDPRCPPATSDAPPSGTTSDGDPGTSSSGGTSSGSTSDGDPGTSSSGGTSSTSSGGTSDGTPPTGGGGHASSSGNNGSSGHGGSSGASSSGNNGSSGHGGSSSSSGETSSGSSGASSSSGGSSGATSSGGGGGCHGGFHCRDEGGTRTCRGMKPKCAKGSHPSACGACVSDDSADDDCVPPTAGGCWVTGGGFVQTAGDKDNFGGNAKPMKRGEIQGHWNHVVHADGRHLGGTVSYLTCRHVDEPGPGNPGGKKGLTANQAYFGGPARFQTGGAWEDGYWFDVVVKDHGEPGGTSAAKKGGIADTYHLTVRRASDPNTQQSGTVVYSVSGPLSGGNIQMHAPNGGHPAIASQLPAWVSMEP